MDTGLWIGALQKARRRSAYWPHLPASQRGGRAHQWTGFDVAKPRPSRMRASVQTRQVCVAVNGNVFSGGAQILSQRENCQPTAGRCLWSEQFLLLVRPHPASRPIWSVQNSWCGRINSSRERAYLPADASCNKDVGQSRCCGSICRAVPAKPSRGHPNTNQV